MTAFLRKTVAAAVAFAAIWVHGTAAADVTLTGAGTWDADAAFTTLSAPNASWSFAFVLPSTVVAGTTAAVTVFSYRLGGASVTLQPSAVTFYGAADGGMFDLAFGDSFPSLSLYGDALLSGGGAVVLGTYAVFVGVSGGQPVGTGSLAVATAPVPEPATWAFCALGLAAIGASRRSFRIARQG